MVWSSSAVTNPLASCVQSSADDSFGPTQDLRHYQQHVE